MVGRVTSSAAPPLAELPGWVTLVRAANPGPMTLEGTNTWVLRLPATDGVLVIDPGPLDEGHLVAVAACGPVAGVLLTHGHPDHRDGLDRFLEITGARLDDGPDPDAGGLRVRRLPTPGHTSDSVCFVVERDGQRLVLTGDTILGRGTTVVAHPDGDLADYLTSLRRLVELVRSRCCRATGPRWGTAPRPPPSTWSTGWPGSTRSARHGRPGQTAPRRSWRRSTPTWTGRCGRPPSSVLAQLDYLRDLDDGGRRRVRRDLPRLRHGHGAERSLLPQLRGGAAGRRQLPERRTAHRHRALRRPLRLHSVVGGSRPRAGRCRDRPRACGVGRRRADLRRSRGQAHRRRDHGRLRRPGGPRGRPGACGAYRVGHATGGAPRARRRTRRRGPGRPAHRRQHR